MAPCGSRYLVAQTPSERVAPRESAFVQYGHSAAPGNGSAGGRLPAQGDGQLVIATCYLPQEHRQHDTGEHPCDKKRTTRQGPGFDLIGSQSEALITNWSLGVLFATRLVNHLLALQSRPHQPKRYLQHLDAYSRRINISHLG